MPTVNTSIVIWNRLPDGSSLKVSITPDDNTFTSAVRCLRDDGREEEWLHPAVCPGPKGKSLVAGHGYVARVWVQFLAEQQSTATIRAWIVKPDGSEHSKRYEYVVRGKTPAVKRATLFCNTAAS